MFQARAAILRKINTPLDLVALTIPDLLAGQVLVDVAYSGICRSQLNEMQGAKGHDPFLPHTLGHEGSGIVRQVGANVTKVAPGDHVVMSWLRGTGHDVPSCVYGSGQGAVNSGAVSTFMTAAVVSENRLVRIDPSTPLRDAALLGCAVATGAGSVLNIASPAPQSTIAIFGLGGIGQCAVMAARNRGLRMIIGVDINQDRLAMGARLGLTHTVDASENAVLASIHSLTNGVGVDYAIEATGDARVMETAFAGVRAGGGKCIIAGNPRLGDTMSLDPFDFIKGRNIVGSWGGGTDIDRDVPIYVRWLSDGMLPVDVISATEYDLENINQALDDFVAGKVLRPIIRMQGASVS